MTTVTGEGEQVQFEFDGKRFHARGGMSLAGALWDAGVHTLSQSGKYHRPRGLYCAGGRCSNCLLEVNGDVKVPACMTPIREGLVARSQRSRSLTPLYRTVARHLPLGFQYHYFRHNRALFHIWERRLRGAAAHSRLPTSAVRRELLRVDADLVVVGGGPADRRRARWLTRRCPDRALWPTCRNRGWTRTATP